MGHQKSIDRAALAAEELRGANLGDRRLEARLERIAEALARNPSESLPKAMRDNAELEATYRFLGNERVAPEAVLAPHQANTLQRCAEHGGRVLALFDTTKLSFGGQREQLGHVDRGHGRGMLAHVGLAVSADGRRDPLGVLHLETVVRQGQKKRRRGGIGAVDRESLRWQRGVEATHVRAPQAICIMDREADVFELLQSMHSRQQDFVIRAAQNRKTEGGLLWDRLAEAEGKATRTVELSARDMRKAREDRKKFPPRSQRETRLELRALTVTLKSPDSTRNDWANRRSSGLEVNVVHVVECNPPSGEPAVEWVLLTSLPIDTAQQVEFIVDAYRARWVVEDFFKALKSGCAIERRQLEGLHNLRNALAVSLPIAWLLLRLRHLSRDEPDRPADRLVSPPMMQCLRVLYTQRTRKTLPERPTCHQLVRAIAALGGHLKRNGEPGFLVLGRGLTELIQAVDLATALQNQDVINP